MHEIIRFPDIHPQHDEYCHVEWGGVGRCPDPWCVRFERHLIYLENGCWIWKSALEKKDSERNRLNFSMRSQYLQETFGLPFAVDACRWIYERAVGPIDSGLTIDHAICENWRCVNPFGLEPVTSFENQQRYKTTRKSWTCRDSIGRFSGRLEVAQ